ncbi:MAG: hypothetical protein LBB20_00845 [Puniceicoccales bacterium]|jgi:hypothetical protein|nr:hypothetical protein [Puniceicoccales bacterium]
MRLFFSSDDRHRKKLDEKVSILLQIKKAERPSKDFWADFDNRLHSKLLEPTPDGSTCIDNVCLFFIVSKRMVPFISYIMCLLVILVAFNFQNHDNRPSFNSTSVLGAKDFVRNELSCISGCHDTISYTSNSQNAICYVSNSMDMDSSYWTKRNNSF